MQGRDSFFSRCNWAQFAAFGGGGNGGNVNPGTTLFYYNDFLGVGVDTSGADGFNAVAVGTSSSAGQTAGLANNPGVANYGTGTDTGGVSTGILGANTTAVNRAIIPSAAVLTYDAVMRLPVLPDGTNTYIAYVGFADRVALGSNRALARVFWNGSAVRWGLETGDGVGETQANASTGPSANTFYHVRLTITSTLVELFIDGVSVATSSTNLGNTGYTLVNKILKSAGTTNRNLDVDLVAVSQTFGTPRYT